MYTLMKDELNRLIQAFPDHPQTTPWQRDTYLGGKGQKKIISHEQFAKELPPEKAVARPVLVLFPRDPEPVGSLGHKAARSFWYHDNDGHTGVPAPDMLRIGLFFHCGLFETFRLYLKNEWEKYLAKCRGYKLNLGAPFSEFIPGSEPTENDFAEFKPDLNEAIDILRRLEQRTDQYVLHQDPACPELLSMKEQFYFLDPLVYSGILKEMILGHLFLEEHDSAAFRAFTKHQQEEIRQNQALEARAQGAFWQKKCYWIELQEEHVQLMYDQEQLALDQAYTKKHFLGLFGQEYIALQEAVFAIAVLKRKIMHKQNDPELSEAKILELIEHQEKEGRKTLEDLQYWACMQMPEITGGSTASQEQEEAYVLEVRQILRELEKMLHPDLLRHHEQYSKLTDQQIADLRNLWERMMTIKSTECIFAEGTLERIYPSLTKLRIIKLEAKQIFFSLGLPWNAKYTIQGQTMDERIQWLNENIAIYEAKIQEEKTRLMAVAQDQRIKEMGAVLRSPATHAKYKQGMAEEVAKLEQEKTALETVWADLVKAGGRHDA